MKKVIIGTLVSTIIFFVYQAAMWMGGMHNNLWIYNQSQDTVLAKMSDHNFKEGLYFIPSADPASKTFGKDMEQIMKSRVGKPWAMVFYHTSMNDMEASNMILDFVYILIGVLVVVLVIYHGRFSSFSARFLAGMAFGIFAIFQAVLDDMNWWSYPWSFVQPQVVDLTIGWAICCLFLAYYLKRPAAAGNN